MGFLCNAEIGVDILPYDLHGTPKWHCTAPRMTSLKTCIWSHVLDVLDPSFNPVGAMTLPKTVNAVARFVLTGFHLEHQAKSAMQLRYVETNLLETFKKSQSSGMTRHDHFLDGIWLLRTCIWASSKAVLQPRVSPISRIGSVKNVLHCLTLFHISQRLEVSTAPFHRFIVSSFDAKPLSPSNSHVLCPVCQLCTLRFLQVAPMPHSSATADLREEKLFR